MIQQMIDTIDIGVVSGPVKLTTRPNVVPSELCGDPESNKDLFGCFKNGAHQSYLLRPLGSIVLIDAYGVDPEC